MMNYVIMQHAEEFDAACELFVREGVRSYLEIGSKYGGSLWRIAHLLPKGARIVSVDLCAELHPRNSLEHCIKVLKKEGFDVHQIAANSSDPQTVERVAAFAPFDLVLIDADHHLDAVRTDWQNYGPMGRMVAFHDISWRRAPEWKGTKIEVPLLWNEIKDDYRHTEYRLDRKAKSNGIGVLWRD